MLKRTLLHLGGFLLAGITCHAGTITLGSHTYAVTTGSYGGAADWDAAIQAEFGSGSSTADFATLKLDAVGNEEALWNFLVSEGLGTAYVEWNGQKTYQGMAIFLQLHPDNPGGGWFVMDNIDSPPTGYPDRIDLGRWEMGDQRILATVTPVPEPSSAFLMLGAGLVAVAKRRRR